MGLLTTKKKDDEELDGKTMSATEFQERFLSMQQIKLQHDQQPNTEILKD